MTKLFGIKTLATFAGLGLSVFLVSGCNPDEPAKTTTPPPPPAKTTPAKPDDKKGAAPEAKPADAKPADAKPAEPKKS
ncbi:hypothetical protein OJF2_22160 [Aquisphaera giovannonii]|uniref:Preprotein translocase subunit SecG n=1 Tax=Aquisphaera giovannonii TaxID=406548 RepID=A0A5B9W168_9BACT|nr:hypothetical protein [Aquisphaera giovannonii]QEH33710.1 hypothetical protein OJF2_22160 [Aquisphaera giovannonii]